MTKHKNKNIIIAILSFLLLFLNIKMAGQSIINLEKNWKIQSSEKVIEQGQTISSEKYSDESWHNAVVPSTIFGNLVKDGTYSNVFMGTNLANVPTEQFKKSWWYRTEFELPEIGSDNVKLLFDGIIYRANIWLNGKQITSADKTFGVYRRFSFDITELAKKKNVLAVEIISAKPAEPSVGFVDWNPKPPDNNMGIWREVKVKISGDASINFSFVKSKIDLDNFKTAELTVSAEVTNNKTESISGTLSGEIGSIVFSKKVDLKPEETKTITFSPNDFTQLKINNPRIWWIHTWGKPELYNLKMNFKVSDKISDEVQTRFGIREVSDYINEQGHRGYKLNGKKLLITGGGWVDHLFLEYDYENIKSQVQYVKHMGLNTIRLEGIWGNNEELYNLCDENGVLLMVGFSCQWEWESYFGAPDDEFGSIKTPEDMKLVAEYWKDQIKWLRNHPSIFVWVGASDKIPRPPLERELIRIKDEEDPSRPYLSSTHQGESEISGRAAVKMMGPYEYVPPMYWSTDTKNGGAYGFNTETGPGPQVPPLESLRKMIPPDHLWPIDSVWNYHCGRNEFNTLDVYNKAINNRLGTPVNLNDYVTKAQYTNYEAMRAMFEAFTANKPVTTGIVQWMLNASWPKLWWQLYDFYLMPNGAFYGAKKALEPIHVQYDYKTHSVIVVNNTLEDQDYLKVKAGIINLDNIYSVKFEKEEYLNIKSDESKKIFELPDLNEIKNLTNTYALVLRLYNPRQEIISNNTYFLSVKPDILDTAKTDWYITPIKEYADLTGLNRIGKVEFLHVKEAEAKHKLNIKYTITSEGDREKIVVELNNRAPSIALQIDLSVTKGKDGESILPVFWEDNYISLFPSEQKRIVGYFYKKDLNGKEPFLQVNGWNIITEQI